VKQIKYNNDTGKEATDTSRIMNGNMTRFSYFLITINFLCSVRFAVNSLYKWLLAAVKGQCIGTK